MHRLQKNIRASPSVSAKLLFTPVTSIFTKSETMTETDHTVLITTNENGKYKSAVTLQ